MNTTRTISPELAAELDHINALDRMLEARDEQTRRVARANSFSPIQSLFSNLAADAHASGATPRAPSGQPGRCVTTTTIEAQPDGTTIVRKRTSCEYAAGESPAGARH